MKKRQLTNNPKPPPGPKRYASPEEMDAAYQFTQAVARQENHAFAPVALGGFALYLCGSPRHTSDLDVISAETPESVAPIADLSFGGVRVLAPNTVPVDFITRDDHYKDLYAEAAKYGEVIAGYRVVSPHYLAAIKLAAHRPKDISDLRYLIKADLVDMEKARKLIRRLISPFAQESFDRIVNQALWEASLDLTTEEEEDK